MTPMQESVDVSTQTAIDASLTNICYAKITPPPFRPHIPTASHQQSQRRLSPLAWQATSKLTIARLGDLDDEVDRPIFYTVESRFFDVMAGVFVGGIVIQRHRMPQLAEQL
jgi:hypothetical protein